MREVFELIFADPSGLSIDPVNTGGHGIRLRDNITGGITQPPHDNSSISPVSQPIGYSSSIGVILQTFAAGSFFTIFS